MKSIFCKASLGATTLLLASYASAATITYTAVLNGANEVPAVASTATGFATLTLSGNILSVSESYSGLVGGPATGAHIHCCSAPGTNAAIAVPFNSFPNTTSGTFSGTFDLTSSAVYTSAFLTANGGTAAGAEAALILGLNSNLAYVNIHDATFPGGEIRGFVTATPEPGTLVLSGLFLLGALALNRRRSQA